MVSCKLYSILDNGQDLIIRVGWKERQRVMHILVFPDIKASESPLMTNVNSSNKNLGNKVNFVKASKTNQCKTEGLQTHEYLLRSTLLSC